MGGGMNDGDALELVTALQVAAQEQIREAQALYGFYSYIRDIIAARVAAGGTAGGVGHGD